MNSRIVVILFAFLMSVQIHAQGSAPKILSIDDETVIDNGYATLYDYSFTVSYVGASSVAVGVEQEYSSYYEIHHVNKVKNLKGKEPWERVMISKRRKTLVVCHDCHQKIHHGF